MMKHLKTTATVGTATLAIHSAAKGAKDSPTKNLLSQLKSSDPKVRTEAWLAAGEAGPPAIKPLASLMVVDDLEVARAGKRAMWRIVHYSGRPGADKEQRKVTRQLLALLTKKQPHLVKVEVVRMLSEIGGDRAIDPLAELLSDQALREDARQSLQRIPGPKATAALQKALELGADDFKAPIASALRARGVVVSGYPCSKLTPTKQTEVVPAGKA
jgi:HEAT repeat protein